MTKSTRLGWIPYWNLYPLKLEIQKVNPHFFDDHVLMQAHPAQINDLLAQNKVDLAPCSSVELLQNPHTDIAFPLGVSSFGSVMSVYIATKWNGHEFMNYISERQKVLKSLIRSIQPMSNINQLSQNILHETEYNYEHGLELPKLILSPFSATSNHLVKILMRLWFGKKIEKQNNFFQPEDYQAYADNVSKLDHAHPPWEVVIGDEALLKRNRYSSILDLGKLWTDLTGLPFVFAVWQKRVGVEIDEVVTNTLLLAAKNAEIRMKGDSSEYIEKCHENITRQLPSDLSSYWEGIDYRLTPKHFKGLLLFLSLVRNGLNIMKDEYSGTKFLRWNERFIS